MTETWSAHTDQDRTGNKNSTKNGKWDRESVWEQWEQGHMERWFLECCTVSWTKWYCQLQLWNSTLFHQHYGCTLDDWWFSEQKVLVGVLQIERLVNVDWMVISQHIILTIRSWLSEKEIDWMANLYCRLMVSVWAHHVVNQTLTFRKALVWSISKVNSHKSNNVAWLSTHHIAN